MQWRKSLTDKKIITNARFSQTSVSRWGRRKQALDLNASQQWDRPQREARMIDTSLTLRGVQETARSSTTTFESLAPSLSEVQGQDRKNQDQQPYGKNDDSKNSPITIFQRPQ